MNYEEYSRGVLDVAWLASCAVKDTVPNPERIRQMDLKVLYKAADRHMMTAITAMALESAGVKEEAFTQAKGKAIRKAAAFDLERAAVLQALEQEGIWYMPLKGAVIKSMYPKLGMRQMSDNDILIDEERVRDVDKIMGELSFTLEHSGSVHNAWFKEPVCNFELHHTLFYKEINGQLYDYYRDVKKRLIQDKPGGFGFHFSDEDFYVYIIAHEYKHYSNKGTGLRSLMDVWVYWREKGPSLDWDYISGELRKTGLEDFELRNRSLALHLFEGEKLTESDEEMLEAVLSSGTYGTRENLVKNRVKKFGGGRIGRLRYILNRIFLPMSIVQRVYPFFYRHKILLPFLWIYRIVKGLTSGRRIAKTELKALFRKKD